MRADRAADAAGLRLPGAAAPVLVSAAGATAAGVLAGAATAGAEAASLGVLAAAAALAAALAALLPLAAAAGVAARRGPPTSATAHAADHQCTEGDGAADQRVAPALPPRAPGDPRSNTSLAALSTMARSTRCRPLA